MLKMCRENKPFVRIIDRHLIEGTNGCKLNVQHNDNVAKSTHTYILHIPNDTYTLYTHINLYMRINTIPLLPLNDAEKIE